MQIRIAEKADLDAIMEVYDRAREHMREAGNPNQWADGYPSRLMIAQDVLRGVQFVCEDDEGAIVGTFCLQAGPEKSYLKIEGEPWLNDVPYFVIHRFAAHESGAGVGGAMMDWICKAANNVRTDTHEANAGMQALLESREFKRCGTIHLTDGSPRIGYHYARPDERTLDKGGILSWLPWRHTGLGR